MDSTLDFRLLNDFQRDFPLCPTPFAEIAARLGVAEPSLLQRLEALRREGKISRVGAVFAPKRIGASTLAAMAVPVNDLVRVAEIVNRFPEVNHNYEREHRFNLWFVATAGSEARLQSALEAIEAATGYPLLSLPLLEEFHIDLGFPLAGRASRPNVQIRPLVPCAPLAEGERRLLSVLQEGLPLLMRPFRMIAERVGSSEEAVLARIGRWLEEGAIKRFGIVVRHRELGFSANAMLVHDIGDGRVADVGRALAEEAAVTLCYRRPRQLPDWPYNLFCMIHGRARSEVEAEIAALRQRHGLLANAHAVLFSRTRFKQQGACYV